MGDTKLVTIHYQSETSAQYRSTQLEGDPARILSDLLAWRIRVDTTDGGYKVIIPHRVTGFHVRPEYVVRTLKE